MVLGNHSLVFESKGKKKKRTKFEETEGKDCKLKDAKPTKKGGKCVLIFFIRSSLFLAFSRFFSRFLAFSRFFSLCRIRGKAVV